MKRGANRAFFILPPSSFIFTPCSFPHQLCQNRIPAMAKASSGNKSRKSGLAGRRPATTAPKAKGEPERVIEFGPPLKPRKGLLVALSVLFALWFAFLLGLYCKSVYPQRHPASTNPAAAAATRQGS